MHNRRVAFGYIQITAYFDGCCGDLFTAIWVWKAGHPPDDGQGRARNGTVLFWSCAKNKRARNGLSCLLQSVDFVYVVN